MVDYSVPSCSTIVLIIATAEEISFVMMPKNIKTLLKTLGYSLTSYRSRWLYQACRFYADRYQGLNNDDVAFNGELHLLQQILPASQVVFDVGANVGLWTQLALEINPQATFHCFEPNAAVFEQLQNRQFPITVNRRNVGLSNTAGQRELHIFEETSTMSSLYQRRGLESYNIANSQFTELIVLETLDNYCQQHAIDNIDFLKMDVEGHELQVLQGATRLLTEQRIQLIQFEYGGCNIDAKVLLRDFFDLLGPLGYTLYKVLPTHLETVPSYTQQYENFQYQNWLASLDNTLPHQIVGNA
ncbi:MAG: FkbM family methyltransferase [Okeania sp. SIO3B3]|nr:FkbM family methyltransferase [Okeania sp. SIO3B3]